MSLREKHVGHYVREEVVDGADGVARVSGVGPLRRSWLRGSGFYWSVMVHSPYSSFLGRVYFLFKDFGNVSGRTS